MVITLGGSGDAGGSLGLGVEIVPGGRGGSEGIESVGLGQQHGGIGGEIDQVQPPHPADAAQQAPVLGPGTGCGPRRRIAGALVHRHHGAAGRIVGDLGCGIWAGMGGWGAGDHGGAGGQGRGGEEE